MKFGVGVLYKWLSIKREFREKRLIESYTLLKGVNVCVCVFNDWLTVHRSITLVNLQLDAQNSYLFTYNTFIKTLYMFRALPCSHLQEVYVVIVYMQPLVLSLSAGDCPVHRLRKGGPG